MSGNIFNKNIRRTVLGSMGRYIAILAIVALGVGFFSGVKNTKESMMLTCDEYVKAQNMYDIRLLSTYGFTEDEVEAVNVMDEVVRAEGAVSADFFSEDRNGNSVVFRAHSMTEGINDVKMQSGRMAKNPDECVADSHFFTGNDIGKTIKIAKKNDEDTSKTFAYDEYKIVGIVNSPYYMLKTERGTTSLGDGTISAYIYMPSGGFDYEYFTEMLVISKEQGFVYSDEYEKNIEKTKNDVTVEAEKLAMGRYEDIVKEAEDEIAEGEKELEDGRSELAEERNAAYGKLEDARVTLEKNSDDIELGKKELSSQRTELKEQRQQAVDGIAMLDDKLEAEEHAMPPEAVEGLKIQRDQLSDNLSKINEGLDKISGEEKKLKEAEKEIEKGYDEYYLGKAEAGNSFAAAEAKLVEGEKELKKAREDLKKLEKPEIHVQDREDNPGFAPFEENADIVDNIAKIFPVFFFLIAALVCSTTMSRMIEEERPQIGVLSALGYTSRKIMIKYMIYSGSAAFIGCIVGFFAGSKFFPHFIWIAYGMMFGFAPLKYHFNWELALISLFVSLLCSSGTTYLACRSQLKNMPAELLRPKAPKAGKRIFLENIGFLWRRLKFLHKVTARNIFRYKKRMFMMIVGIGGCTALVLTGFGINDSVAGIADHQYSEVEKYHMTVAFSEPVDDKKQNEFKEEYEKELKNTALLKQTSVNVKNDKAAKSCSLMISDDENINKAVNFSEDGKKLEYPKKGEALINNKLAEMLGVETGDRITLNYDDTENTELTVTGIYKNYVSNYVYINEDTYEHDMGKEYDPSMFFVTFKDGVDIHHISEEINSFDGVMGISVNEDVKSHVNDMMISLNYIIVLVIGCAGALAFIVLFNLGNINITEREREIATIQVLGFYPRETASYVFRENLILVLFGIAAGIPAGMALHKFVMNSIVVDMVSFNEVIEPISFLYTVAVVLGFALIVDIILRRKLRRINMAEALKSIE